MRKLWALCLSLVLLRGCSAVQVSDYSDFKPVLTPEPFFDGQLAAHGVIKNRGGQVIRTFSAEINASWKDGVGTLVEDFVFDDGELQQRIWVLRPQADGSYAATAGDVVGTAQMNVAGNSAFMDYVLSIAYGDSTLDLRVDDRMYLLTPDVLINESEMSKFGVRVGSIDLVILRQGELSTAQ